MSITPTILALFAFTAIAHAQNYQVAELDSNHVLNGGAGMRINEKNETGGFGNPIATGSDQAVFFDAAGSHPLPNLTGDEVALAVDVNEVGVLVGTSTDIVDLGFIIKIFNHAAVWNGGGVTDVGTLVTSGATQMQLLTATSINDQGVIIGSARDPNLPNTLRGFRLENGFISDIGDLGGFGGTTTTRIDRFGRITGYSAAVAQFTHAFVWENGVMTDLHDPLLVPGRNSRADDINRFGVVCGAADFIADFIDWETGAIWDHGTVTDIGTLGGIVAEAYGLNDLGVAVGGTVLANGENRAFLWRKSTGMIDLNTLIPPNSGWILLTAQDVNNNGRIVGQGLFNNAWRGFVLTPACNGSFTTLAPGCTGTSGIPSLSGVNCPTPGNTFALEVANARPNAFSVMFAGSGTGTLPIVPSCALQIAPLFGVLVPLTLDADGSLFLPVEVPTGTPSVDVNLQLLIADPAANGGVAATNALKVHVG